MDTNNTTDFGKFTYFSIMYNALFVCSFIAFIVSIFTYGSVSYNASLSGYTTLVFAILMVLLLLIIKDNSASSQLSGMKKIGSAFLNYGSILSIGCIAIYMLYLNIKYKEEIEESYVPAQYTPFNISILILFLVQLFTLNSTMLNVFKKSDDTQNVTASKIQNLKTFGASLILLISAITLPFSITIHIMLKNYITDGFTNMK